jgi:hypothetical protein
MYSIMNGGVDILVCWTGIDVKQCAPTATDDVEPAFLSPELVIALSTARAFHVNQIRLAHTYVLL